MARSTSAKWDAAFEGDATGEQPLDLITITHPDLSALHVKVVNDNDYFARDASQTEITGEGCAFDASAMRVTLDTTNFFTPSPPEDEFMSRVAFFKFLRTGGSGDSSNDGNWQIKTIEDGKNAILFPRRTMATQSSVVGTFTYMETFAPVNFSVTKPTERSNEVPVVTLTVGLNDPSFINQLIGLSSAPRVVLESVLRSEPDYVQLVTPQLDWSVLEFNRDSITGTLSGPSALNMEVPHDSKTPYLRPGLYNLI